jgi:hypothetical protein
LFAAAGCCRSPPLVAVTAVADLKASGKDAEINA